MHLQDAEPCRLGEHALPGRGVELAAALHQLAWIGAVRALQWAAMRQLGQQREGRVG